jgi:hypothetical protein
MNAQHAAARVVASAVTRPLWVVRVAALVVGLLALAGAAHAQRVNFEDIVDAGAGATRSWVDVNNDGKDDYCVLTGGGGTLECYISQGTAGFQTTRITYAIGGYPTGLPYWWTDINGDGQVDLCRLMGAPGFSATVAFQCRLGPNFASSPISFTLPSFASSCTQDGCSVTSTGLGDQRDVFMADVDADGRSDLCYLYAYAETGPPEVRCHLSTGAGFAALTSAWTRGGVAGTRYDWPRGFFDVNGDGFPDYCRVDNGVYCVLGGEGGFASTPTMDIAIASTSIGNKEGAAFVDINGDGKTDFCRYNASTSRLVCRLSSGKAWLTTDQATANSVSSSHSLARWWADVNGDGLPDFCRAVGPDPNATGNMSNLWCRLSRGGDSTTGLFAPQDLKFDEVTTSGAVHFGVNTGGRAFCDAFGTGVQTFCRATQRTVSTGQSCYEGESGQVCYDTSAKVHGIAVGVYGGLGVTSTHKDQLQANLPLLAKYSDGLGAETRVSYMPLSNDMVYKRNGVGTGFPRVQMVTPRSPVVFETRAWRTSEQITLTGNARYFYKDLRVDNQAGSRGFRERWFLSEGANTLEHATYYQGLGPGVDTGSIDNDTREIGVTRDKRVYAIDPNRITPSADPRLVSGNTRQKFLAGVFEKATTGSSMTTTAVAPTSATTPFMLLRRTVSTLGDTVPANPLLRVVTQSTTSAWDWQHGAAVTALPVVNGTSQTSIRGNVELITETTTHAGQTWSKETTNTYADNAAAWLLGRLTRAQVVSNAPTADAQIAANPGSAGTSPNATATSSSAATVPQLVAPIFMNTQVGQTSTASATLTNNSGGTLVLTPPAAASVTGSSVFSFQSTTCGAPGAPSTQLANNASCTITIRFAPTGVTTSSGAVSVETASGPRTATFQATSLASFSTATLTAAPANLGEMWLGQTAPSTTATFRNDGNSAMTLSGLSGMAAPFQLTGNTCSNVAAGASCSMTIAMPTGAAGSGPINVTTVGATNNTSFTLNGRVNSAVSRWSVTSLAFGNVTVGQSSTQAVTVYNDGFGLAINWAGALANLPAGFSATTSSCGSVVPGSSCGVSITFAPTAAQAYSGSSIYPSNISYTNNTLAVSGTGVHPATTISTSTSSLSWGTVPGGATISRQFTLTNTGANAALGLTYGITGTGFFTPSGCSSLAAGASCTVYVWYESSCQNASHFATLTISGLNLTANRQVSLSATTSVGPIADC